MVVSFTADGGADGTPINELNASPEGKAVGHAVVEAGKVSAPNEIKAIVNASAEVGNPAAVKGSDASKDAVIEAEFVLAVI